MRTQELSVLDADYRRPGEVAPWLASSLAPVAWLAHLIGAPSAVALVLCVIGLLASYAVLRSLHSRGDRSKQHAWFLAQAGVALSTVATLLVGLAVIF